MKMTIIKIIRIMGFAIPEGRRTGGKETEKLQSTQTSIGKSESFGGFWRILGDVTHNFKKLTEWIRIQVGIYLEQKPCVARANQDIKDSITVLSRKRTRNL